LLPLRGTGERIGRVKERKLMGYYNHSLIGKARAIHATKTKQAIHLLLPISRQVFSHFQESRAPSHTAVTLADKCHHSECPLLPHPS